MLFNSWEFALFFCVVFAAYLLSRPRHRVQNLLLLVASYVFYGWWKVELLGLIVLSTLIDYVCGLRIAATPSGRGRKLWVTASIVTNLGILGTFKYAGFFVDSLQAALTSLGITWNLGTLSLVLPVGISFYTFQSMSYTIDVYRGHSTPCRNLLDFALYISFFPQLVAGPIERSFHLLRQIGSPRVVDAAGLERGLWLIVWGLFKKIVVADNAALVADPVFASPGAHSGAELVVAALAFTIQIYGDFSGYSDMARGLARLLGFDLMVNFKLPYFAVSPSDFWRRWHVSLSSWLRDYLYIPLGGSRGGAWATHRNLALTMLLGGLWHGAAWNFVAWGAYHGALLVAYRAARARFPHLGASAFHRVLGVAAMFGFTVFGWVIFRIESLGDLRHFVPVGSWSLGSFPEAEATLVAACWLPVLAVQASQLAADDLLAPLRLPAPLRGALLGALLVACLAAGVGESKEFIYFQF